MLLTVASSLAVLAPGAALTLDASGDAPPCEAPQVVPGQGLSCPALGGDGWLVILDDGTIGLTHGPDHGWQFPESDDGGLVAASSTRAMPVCVEDASAQKHNLLVYTYPADAVSRLADLAPTLRDMVNQSNSVLLREAERYEAQARYIFECDTQDTISVAEVQLATNASDDSFSSIVQDLRDAGYRRSTSKYWVWHDGGVGGGIAGQAYVHNDDRLVRDNENTYGPDYAVTYGQTGSFGAKVMMHESGHNLGAVQLSAPHTSGGWHCNDGYDVMCYDDGGPTSDYTTSACSTERFDCNNDDYFHPDPPEGNYLATHWNVGSRLNPFIDFGPPPLRPPVILDASCSPTSQAPDTDVSCAFRAEDDQPIYLDVDWGDGTTTRVPEQGAMTPGQKVWLRHSWSTGGAFTINATFTDTADPPLNQSTELIQNIVCTARHTGRLFVGLQGVELNSYSATSRSVHPICDGAPFLLMGGSNGDFDVCWRDAAGATLRCDANRGGEAGLVPAGTATARIILRSGFNANYDMWLG